MIAPRHLRPDPGPSFAHDLAPRRTRIAGSSAATPALKEAFQKALGPDTAVLSPETPLVVDADACLFGGRALTSAEAWLRVLQLGALGRVEGAFALAQRTSEGEVFLARDAIGHRSLYYLVHGDQLLFASRLIALLDVAALPRRLCLRSVAAYLAYAYLPGPETMVEGVFELLLGEQVTFVNGVIHRSTHWDLPAEPSTFDGEEVLRLRLRARLEEVVQQALPGGAPVAISLSGGIDSSLIAALAARLHDAPVHTFSITFGAGHRNELAWSTLVADHCHTQHTVVELTPAAIAAHLDDTIACLDKPNGDPLTVPNALLFREMGKQAEVALNGEGGDPCFGGPKNLPMLLAELYGNGAETASGRRARERSFLRAHLKCHDDLPKLLTPAVMAEACSPPLEEDLAPWFDDPRWSALVTRLMAINVRFKGGHHILPKVDSLSAPFGVFARSPLFARSVVELAFTIPPRLMLHGAVEKYLLKQAVADLLPAAILDRPKSGMMVPVEGWFQGPLLHEARSRILDGLAPRGLFQRRYLEDLLDGKTGGLRPRHGVKIWLLITLEAHLRALGMGCGEPRAIPWWGFKAKNHGRR
ncbi:MAG: asparagine synthetase B family protein [Minicystis sp.]